MIDNILQDLTFTFRLFRRSPGFAIAVVLTLGIGIGVNVAIYSVVHAVLLSQLPFPQPDRLVAISDSAAGHAWPTSYPNYLDWKAAQHSFRDIAVSRRDDFNLTGAGEPERYSGLFVTASYFRVLEVPPLLGRTFFDAEDSAPGANPVVLSEHLWRSRFAADPSIIGRRITLNTISYEVVGVVADKLSLIRNPETSRNSQGDRNADLYAPLGFYASRPYLHDRSDRVGFYGIARLKRGISLEQASADMKVIARNLAVQYPEANTGSSIVVTSLRDSIIGQYRAMLWLLEAAVGLVLLITCANVANLFLVRTTAREKEIAVRAALGASRQRLIGQLLTESIVLAVCGGALGCLLAFWSKDVIISLSPPGFPRLQELSLNIPVLAFSAIITLAASLIFGLAPAWRLSKVELHTVSKSVGGSRPHRTLGTLIIGQVALACLLLTAAGLLVQTFRALEDVPLGFNPSHLLTVGIKLPGRRYHESIDQTKFYQLLLEKIKVVPGVKEAAVDDDIPFSGFRAQENFTVVGRPEPRRGQEPIAETHCVSPDYFKTMGIPLLRGRSFRADDVLGKPHVVLIDEDLARTFFRDQDPIGQQLSQQLEAGPKNALKMRYTIIGVVPSVRHGEAGVAPKIPQIYWSAAQFPSLQTTLIIRTVGKPESVLPAVRAAVRSIDSELPVFGARTMEAAIGASIGNQRISAALLGGFSILALFLAAFGLYGVLAYSVAQRTREIGIRIALGAPRANIFGLIVRRGMTLVAVGLSVGVTLSIICGPLFQHFLYGVAPRDPATIVTVSFLLVAIAIVACWFPARRAVRVDPLVALRQE